MTLAEQFAEDVVACGKLGHKRARSRGWHTQTIKAAVRHGFVRREVRSHDLGRYTVYLPIKSFRVDLPTLRRSMPSRGRLLLAVRSR